MARMSPLEPRDANREVRSLYDLLRKDLMIEPNNFFKTMAHHPELLRPLIEFSRVMLEGGVLDRRLKEWVILQIGRMNNCDYVYLAHKHALSRAIMNDVIDDRRLPLDTSSFSEAEKIAIRYAGQITENAVDEETFADARRIFNDEELVELTVLAGYYNFICRTCNALDIDMDALQFLQPHLTDAGRAS
ncbi:MAG TPA: hypothetical protein V6D47_05525 [Oscillatoriaceae cyanobacterium]